LKAIGMLAAAPMLLCGAALALPISLVAGICHGAAQVDSSKPRDFTVGAAGVAGFSRTRKDLQDAEKGLREGLDEMGTKKLAPGEKPYDIPLMKTAKTLAIGAASAAVGGATGVVCALLSMGRQIGAGVAHAAADPTLHLPGKVLAGAGAVLGGVAQGASYGLAGAFNVLGRGVADTWKKDSLVEGGESALRRAADLVKAAVAPEATLTHEVAP